MTVFAVALSAIARMRCAECQVIMGQGERERNPSTLDGRPIHQTCLDDLNATKELERGR